MPWNARLELDHLREGPRTVARYRHDGPLRILQSLYPEGDAICHNVLVHPPGGLVGGDTLQVQVRVHEGAHGLVSTPGATRFYRSDGDSAVQDVQLELAPGARLEWLPLETIAYDGCRATNRMHWSLGAGAELIAWELLALGLPAANAPFERGHYTQQIQWPGVWLERARIDATDRRLLDAPAGLAGQRCMGLLAWACAEPLARERREQVVDALREMAQASAAPGVHWGVTAPNPHLVVVRTLAPVVEPAMQLMRALWAVLRRRAWQLDAPPPRIWSV